LYLKTDKLNELLKDYDLYKQVIELQKLKIGEYFGCRAILNENNQLCANFSIVADSLETKVFLLKLKHFALLPENSLVKIT
jgi:hypothetical protein